MRTITKSNEPQSLTEHRANTHSNYNNYPDKDGLREVLVRDQGAICCYCMRRIKPNRDFMKIEHFCCQKHYPQLDITFSNLFAACLGNDGQPEDKQHCDTKKGDLNFCKDLINTPFRLEDLIHYRGNGEIFAKDPQLNKELSEVLNLNFGALVNNRKAALDAFKQVFQKRKNKGQTIPRAKIEQWIRDWSANGEQGATLRPYCQVVVYWLKKRLNRG